MRIGRRFGKKWWVSGTPEDWLELLSNPIVLFSILGAFLLAVAMVTLIFIVVGGIAVGSWLAGG